MLEAVNVYKVFFQLCIYIGSFVGTELYTVVICYITSPFYIRVCAQLLIMILHAYGGQCKQRHACQNRPCGIDNLNYVAANIPSFFQDRYKISNKKRFCNETHTKISCS